MPSAKRPRRTSPARSTTAGPWRRRGQRRRVHRREHRAARCAATPRRHRGRQDRLRGRLQSRSPEPFVNRLRPNDGVVRKVRRLLRFRNPAVQHQLVPWPPDAEHPAFVCAVRTGDHLGTDARQARGRAQEGQMDRRAPHPGVQPQTVRWPRVAQDALSDTKWTRRSMLDFTSENGL